MAEADRERLLEAAERLADLAIRLGFEGQIELNIYKGGQREPHRVDRRLPEETTRVIGRLLVIAMYSLLVFAGVLAVAGCGR
jgi:hypothetical protein